MDVGDTVPDLDLTLDDGRSVRLSELLADGPVVLFFYPKAFTPGCTAESCHFRDLQAEFDEVGAQRIGISRDDVDTQSRFRDEYDLDYPLAADPDGEIAKVFGAKRVGPLPSRRQTFVIGADRTLLATIGSETDMRVHADEALATLRKRAA